MFESIRPSSPRKETIKEIVAKEKNFND